MANYCLFLENPKENPDAQAIDGPYSDFAQACTRASIRFSEHEKPIYVAEVVNLTGYGYSRRHTRLARTIARTLRHD